MHRVCTLHPCTWPCTLSSCVSALTSSSSLAAWRRLENGRALVLAGPGAREQVGAVKAGRPSQKMRTSSSSARIIRSWGAAGLKLAHALDAFHVDVTGRFALDIGASTGGFTDVSCSAARAASRRARRRSRPTRLAAARRCASARSRARQRALSHLPTSPSQSTSSPSTSRSSRWRTSSRGAAARRARRRRHRPG